MLHYLKLLIIIWKLQNILIIHGFFTCLIIFYTFWNISKISHILALNVSLFKLKLSFCFCYFLLIWLFQTITTLISSLSSLKLSYLSLKCVFLDFALIIALILFLIRSSPRKTELSTVCISSVPLAGSILKLIKICQASHWL